MIQFLCQGFENENNEFPVSMAYLRMIIKVYKCELPHMLLNARS